MNKINIQQVITAIKNGYKEGIEKCQEVQEPDVIISEVNINDKPLENGKKWIERGFSGCGSVSIWLSNRKLANILKYIAKYNLMPDVRISKNYKTGHNLHVGKGYSNGHIAKLEKVYQTIESKLRNLGYDNVYMDSHLD